MAKLECTECSNKKKWKDLITKQGKYEVTCFKCGHKMTGTGGVELDEVVGGMVMFGPRW